MFALLVCCFVVLWNNAIMLIMITMLLMVIVIIRMIMMITIDPFAIRWCMTQNFSVGILLFMF